MNAMNLRALLLGFGLAFAAAASMAQQGIQLKQVMQGADISCGKLFIFNQSEGTCTISDAVRKALTADKCTGPGLTYVEALKECIVVKESVPKPECKADNVKLEFDATLKQCVVKADTPKSAPGNYKGDCFRLNTASPISGLENGEMYTVTDQGEADANGDKQLSMKKGKFTLFPTIGCKVADGDKAGPLVQAKASELVVSGATRYGYAYGLLTMPYKYYPSAKSFESGAPIGGYMGWRMGQAASGFTLALALTLGSVKADTVDPKQLDVDGKPKVTGSTNVSALSYAAGFVFDVAKDPKAKPFKAGFFVGKDFVNNDPSVQYRFNRKTWIAVQIGYDFTD